MLKLEDLFFYSDLLPILVILFFIKKIREWPIWLIAIYCTYSFTNNMVILYYNNHHIKFDNLLRYFTLFEYLLFSTILYLLIKNKLVKKIMLVISPIFVLFCIYYIYWGKADPFDSLQTSIECFIIIILCLYYFFEQLTNPEFEFIYSSYKFWIILGLLLYLAGSFFLFVFASQISDKAGDKYWPILYVCGIIRNILLTISVYLSTRPRDEEPYQSLI